MNFIKKIAKILKRADHFADFEPVDLDCTLLYKGKCIANFDLPAFAIFEQVFLIEGRSIVVTAQNYRIVFLQLSDQATGKILDQMASLNPRVEHRIQFEKYGLKLSCQPS